MGGVTEILSDCELLQPLHYRLIQTSSICRFQRGPSLRS